MKLSATHHRTKDGFVKRNPSKINLTENQVKLIMTGLDWNDKAQTYWNKYTDTDNEIHKRDAEYYKYNALKILSGFSHDQINAVRELRK